jgi:hypothetical protein
MANISDARGTIVLEGEWTKEQIKDILYVLYSQDTDYDYTLGIQPANIKEHIDALYNDTGLNFYGAGRWSFTNNLEMFNEWTNLSEEHYKSTLLHRINVDYDDYMNARKRAMQAMVRNKLGVSFYYADIETGVDMAYKIDVTIGAQYYYNTVDKTDSIDFVTHVGTEEVYECNMRFMCEEVMLQDDRLYDYVQEYMNVHKIKDLDLNLIIYNIKKHPEWLGISVYSDVLEDDQNKPLLNLIKKLMEDTECDYKPVFNIY